VFLLGVAGILILDVSAAVAGGSDGMLGAQPSFSSLSHQAFVAIGRDLVALGV